MKILWASNAPFCGSGYGVQTALFGARIAETHDLRYYANWGVQGACLDWNGCQIYPSDGQWGNRTLVACAAHHGDPLEDCRVIALCDAWVLNPDVWPDELKLAVWAPVDHWPLPPSARAVLSRPQVTPIAMSRFGEQMMRDAGLDPLYVPHGVETDLFAPHREIRDDIRSQMNLPAGAFVVGVVAANQGSPAMHRKAYPQMFRAFARFHETHPDSYLYVHTNEIPHPDGGGLNLRAVADACGVPRQALVFTEAFAYTLGIPRPQLADLYQGFDVLLASSMGEGFGVPIIEAQASGVPVIVTDHSAMTELCGAGWLVDGDDWFDGYQDAWFKSPSVDSIVAALGQAYGAADGMVGRAREFGLRYDADRVFDEFWQPALERLEVREQVTA